VLSCDDSSRLIISESKANLTSHAGLGLIGMALNQCTNLAADADAVSSVRRGTISHSDILSSYVALLYLGKSDFEAINRFREDPYFAAVLGFDQVPSEGTLRQRMDGFAEAFKPVLEEAAIAFLRRSEAPLTSLANGLLHWIAMSHRSTTRRPRRRASRVPTKAWTVMPRWRPIWGKRATA